MTALPAYADPNHPGNSPEHRTGKPCIDCGEPAGTYWGPYWCQPCNVKRMERIDRSFADIAESFGIYPKEV